MQQTAHYHIFTTTKRKPAITTIQQIARNHVRKESLQSHQCNKQPTITYGKKACNHTNATNSPQSHIHNYKKKACNHNNPTNSPQSCTERKPAITPMQQTAHNHILTNIKLLAIRKSAKIFASHTNTFRPQSLWQSHQCTQTCLLWTTMFPTINTQV